jgi:hypothetical protein
MIDEVRQTFCSLPAQDQARFLARLLHESTMWARSRYPEIRPDDPAKIVKKLKGFNEFSHLVSAQLRAILEGNEARYPDYVFFDILVEQSCMTDFASEVGSQMKSLYEECIPRQNPDKKQT